MAKECKGTKISNGNECLVLIQPLIFFGHNLFILTNSMFDPCVDSTRINLILGAKRYNQLTEAEQATDIFQN